MFFRISLFALAVCGCAAQTAPSEETGSTKPEPRKYVVVVTGTYQPVPLEESDRTVRVFEVQRDRTLVNSVSDYLQMDSSVDLRRRAPGDIQGDLSIRGGGFSQSLVLLNGMRLNDAQSGHHNLDLPVPLDAITEIQILHGSGSTQYGSDAVTGVVNLLAAPPSSELRLRGALGNSGINQQSGTLAFAGSSLSQSFIFARDFSTGFLPDRDYRNLSLTSISQARTRLGATDVLLATSDRPFGADQFYGNFNSWERTRGWFASLRQELGPRTEVDFAFRRHTDLFVLYRDRPQVFENRHALESWQGAIRRSDPLSTNSRLSYGFESYADSIASTNLGDHSRIRGAGYAAWDARLFRRVSLTAGLRDEVYGSFNHQLSPTVAAGAWLSPRLKLRAAVSRAFRLPTYTDLYYHDPANLGSPDLRPEKAWNYEGGADFQVSARLRATATVFQRRDTDLIDYVRYSPNDIYRATNFQHLTFTGFEGMLEWQPRSRGILSIQYTGLSGRRDVVAGAISKYVFNYPIHNGIVTWQGGLLPGLAARTRIGVTDRFGRDPYAVWDVAAARSQGRVRPFLQLSNLTDTAFQEILGVMAPNRTVIGGVELRVFGDVH
jgi:iron complex outermembrane receptor protein